MAPKNGKTESPVVDAEFVDETALAKYKHSTEDLALTPVFNLESAKNRLKELQDFVKSYLIEGEDFGTIPGTPKATLYKPGADKLCDIYGIADQYRVTNRVEDWDKNLFDYEVECTLVSKRTGHLIATGLGSCSSYESKYRYRDAKRKCPKCGKDTIIKGHKDYGGGYVCWKKDGKSDGCGAKFTDTDQAIVGQTVGRVENDNIPDQKNTILKMAKKRAKVDAVLSATRSSGLFTQDIEDWAAVETHEEKPAAPATPKPAPPVPAAKPQVQAPKPTPKQASAPAPTAKPAAMPEPTKPPKAEIPKTLPVSKETPAKQNSVIVKEICTKAGVSTTAVVAFMAKHLSVEVSAMAGVPREAIAGTLWALQETLGKFPGQTVGEMIEGSLGAGSGTSVHSYFLMAYAKSQNG
jgi:ribosomal protein S27AE